ncbi:hypothetical protein, partial [Escherichia coli]|uniref:hypothetical protein n=1 Tax=Escherichia coli TaxID=562 RepID=UPI0034E396CD
ADRNRSHWSTSKTPSYTKSVSWQHHQQNGACTSISPMQDDKYHGRIENHQSGKSLEFHTVPFILPYHFAKF